jgi:hypothetical protein
MTGPMPGVSIGMLPDASTRLCIRAALSVSCFSSFRISATRCPAMSLRTVSTSPAGRTDRNSLAARSADSWVGAPPGIAQQRVELVDRAHPGLRQVHTPFVQESQRRGVILGREVPPVSL